MVTAVDNRSKKNAQFSQLQRKCTFHSSSLPTVSTLNDLRNVQSFLQFFFLLFTHFASQNFLHSGLLSIDESLPNISNLPPDFHIDLSSLSVSLHLQLCPTETLLSSIRLLCLYPKLPTAHQQVHQIPRCSQ